VDLVDYVKLLRRRWQIPFVCLMIGAVLGWSTASEPEEFVARSGNFFSSTHYLEFDTEAASSWMTLQELAFRVQVGEVSEQVASELGLANETVQQRVQGTPAPEISMLAVVAIGERGTDTAALANTSAEALVVWANEEIAARYNNQFQELTDRRQELQAARQDLERQVEDAEGAEASSLVDELFSVRRQLDQTNAQIDDLITRGEPGQVVDTLQANAAVPISEEEYQSRRAAFANPIGTGVALAADPDQVTSDSDTSMGPRLRAALGAFLGFIIGVGIILLLDRFDTRLRTKKEAEEHFGLPVIAEIPPLHRSQRSRAEIVVRSSPRSRIAESYRSVRTSILFVAASGARSTAEVGVPAVGTERGLPGGAQPWLLEERGEALTVLISSPGPEEGKTSTTANLAALLAEAGMRVLVVNCDYRRPRIHKYFEGKEVPTPSAQDGDQLDGARGARIIDTAVPGVRLVTGIGEHDPEANPAQVIVAQRKVVQVARRHFDVILLDTAPLLTTNDAVEILAEADLVVLTCRYGRTKREQAELAGELLERLGAPVVGTVFIESPDAPQAQYYYYYLDPVSDRKIRRDESSAVRKEAAAERKQRRRENSSPSEDSDESATADATVAPLRKAENS
jgi:Mrp family chromosome partitioning ATPase